MFTQGIGKMALRWVRDLKGPLKERFSRHPLPSFSSTEVAGGLAGALVGGLAVTAYAVSLRPPPPLSRDAASPIDWVLNGLLSSLTRRFEASPDSNGKASVQDKELYDLRSRGFVTSVRSQANSGFCTAHASITAIEGAHFFSTGQLIENSDQQIIDCAVLTPSGGFSVGAIQDYLISFPWVTTRSNYPSHKPEGKGFVKKRCKRKNISRRPMAYVLRWETINVYDEEAMMKVITQQPVLLGFNPHGDRLRSHASGIYEGPFVSSALFPPHAVAIVGYGTTLMDEKFWIVKNSWGESWGDGGYFRLTRKKGNGRRMGAWVPVTKSGSPDDIWNDYEEWCKERNIDITTGRFRGALEDSYGEVLWENA